MSIETEKLGERFEVSNEEAGEILDNSLRKMDNSVGQNILESYILFAAKRLLRKDFESAWEATEYLKASRGVILSKGSQKRNWKQRDAAWACSHYVKMTAQGETLLVKAKDKGDVFTCFPIFGSYLAESLAKMDKSFLYKPQEGRLWLIKRRADALSAPYGDSQKITKDDLIRGYGGKVLAEDGKHDDDVYAQLVIDSAIQEAIAERDEGMANAMDKELRKRAQSTLIRENQEMDKLDILKADAKAAIGNAAKRQSGRAALALIHTTIFKKLPLKWSFWAKITGQKQKIIESPYTKLVSAAAAHALVTAIKPESKVTYVTKGALQFALDDALDKGIDVEKMIEKMLGVDETALDKLISEFAPKDEK